MKLVELFDVVKTWDLKVRAILHPDGFWFAPLSSKTRDIDPSATQIGVHRPNRFRKDLNNWLTKYLVDYHPPHDFRRGHASYLFDNAKDINDLEAARENLMHESLTTTERYARQKRSQRKARILQMSNTQIDTPQPNIQAEILDKLNSLAQTLEMLRSQ